MAINMVDFVNQTTQPRKKALVQKITNESVFLRIFNFIPVDGLSYEYGEQSATGGIAYRSINESYTEDYGVVNPRVEPLRIFGGIVKTDHQLVNKQGNIARANTILAKTRRAGLFFDKEVIDGDDATNPKAIRGLNKRLIGNQVISAGTNGAALTLALVDILIDRVLGPNAKKVLVMCKEDRRKLKALILASAGGAAVSDVGGSLASYDGVKIEVIDEDGDDTPILAKDETQGSSNVTSSMYCLAPGSDVDGELIQGLVGSQMIETYPSGMEGPMHVDVLDANMGIALFHGRCAARLKGIL
jgi:hypothetical protein